MSRSANEQIYHVWFSTKGRQEILNGDVRDRVKRLLLEIARQNAIHLFEIETALDHVHLLVMANEDQPLPSIMHRLKGASSRAVSLELSEIKTELGQKSLWQKGYGRRRLAPQEIETVRRYIRTQNERPHRHDS